MGADTGWTIETYALHNEAMRIADEKFQTERDKRYTEGNELRAMALKIKETADANALELASESQTYKEARNDAMREQNLKETGVYATRDDITLVIKTTRDDLALAMQDIRKTLQPLVDFVSGQQGSDKGSTITKANFYTGITVGIAVIGAIILIGNTLF